jgi:hypothetical protein
MDLTMLIPIFGILLVMIPVAGLTFALTLRLAVRPFVETLAKAMKESGHVSGTQDLTAQLMVLQEEFETLTHEVRELRSAQDFDQNLLAERDEHVTPAG